MSSSVPKLPPHLPIQLLSLLKHNWQKMVKKSAEGIHGTGGFIALGYAFCWQAGWVGVAAVSALPSPSYIQTDSLSPCWICTHSCNILTWCTFSNFFFLLILVGNGQQRRRSIQDLSVAGTDSNQVNAQCGWFILNCLTFINLRIVCYLSNWISKNWNI